MDNDREPSWRHSERETVGTPAESATTAGRRLKKFVLAPLVLSYLTELIFTIWEFDKKVEKPYYPFFDGITYEDGSTWNGWVTDCVFVYGFMETAARGLIFVSAAIASWYGVRMSIFFVCITLEIIDMFDYWLFYNHTWFNTGIEFNYIKIGITLICAWMEYSKSPRP